MIDLSCRAFIPIFIMNLRKCGKLVKTIEIQNCYPNNFYLRYMLQRCNVEETRLNFLFPTHTHIYIYIAY